MVGGHNVSGVVVCWGLSPGLLLNPVPRPLQVEKMGVERAAQEVRQALNDMSSYLVETKVCRT